MEIAELYKLYQQHPQITTDSRDCPKGSIFLALKGESFDGNQFAASALEKGCAYAIIDDKSVIPDGDNRFILVDNCLQTFKDLARTGRPLRKNLLRPYYLRSSTYFIHRVTSTTMSAYPKHSSA